MKPLKKLGMKVGTKVGTKLGIISVLFLSFGHLACFQTKQSDDQGFIRIGEVETLTGAEAGIGTSIHRGVELAVEAINAAGGIHGRKIELLTLDDQGRPEEAALAVTKLIRQSHVRAILGASASSRSIAIAAIAQRFQTPMITPTSTHPKVTEMGDFIFRVCFMDSFQGEAMAHFAVDSLHAKKVAIFRDMKSDYSVGLADFFSKAILKGKGEIVADHSYSSGDIDFKSQLTSIRSKKPDVIFIPGYYTDVALIARQAREIGIHAPLLGGDGWSSQKLIEIGGRAMENSYYANHYSNADPDLVIQKFISEYRSKHQIIPDGLAALGYDSTQVLVHAMKIAQTMSAQEIKKNLTLTQDFQGVTGKISMDANRNASKSVVILKIENGIPIPYSRVNSPKSLF